MALLVKMVTALIIACGAPYRQICPAFPTMRNMDFTCSISSLGLFSKGEALQLREAMIWKSSGQCIVEDLSHRSLVGRDDRLWDLPPMLGD